MMTSAVDGRMYFGPNMTLESNITKQSRRIATGALIPQLHAVAKATLRYMANIIMPVLLYILWRRKPKVAPTYRSTSAPAISLGNTWPFPTRK